MTVRESARKLFAKVRQAVWRLCLFLWTFIRRVLLFALTIAPLALPALALLCLYVHWTTVEGRIESFGEDKRLVQALSLLIGAGVLTWVITTLGKCALNQLREIGQAAWSAWSDGWRSAWKILEGSRSAWCDYLKEVPNDAWRAFKEAKYLTLCLVLGVFLVALYPMFAPKQPTQNVYRYVSVFGATAAEQSREIKLVLRPGAVFSLHHVDARPQEGKGICLDPPQQNLLKEIRKAIENRVAKCKSAPTFEVKGYASVAPMHVDGDTGDSAKLNCKVANWRAAAVGTFLVDPHEYRHEKWCQDAKNIFNQEQLDGCGDFTKTRKGKDANSKPKFLVNIHQWASPSEMIESKPADDGEVPDPRRYDVEILNRVVRIEVPENFCGTAASGAGTP